MPPDTAERTSEIASIVSSLQFAQITPDSLRKLSTLSKERPLREDDDGASVFADPQAKPEGSHAFWEGTARTFSRIFDGLAKFLVREDVGLFLVPSLPIAADGGAQALDRRDTALVLLKDLVENQFPAFAGDELEVFELLLKLREDTSRTVRPSPSSFAYGTLTRPLPRPSRPSKRSRMSSARDSSPCTVSDPFDLVSRHTSPNRQEPGTQSRTRSVCASSANSLSASRARSWRTSCQSSRA